MSKPSILDYSDLSLFMKAHLSWKKEKHPSFSHTAWSKMLGIKGRSLLTMVISGARLPSKQLAKKLIQYFDFDQDEVEQFNRLLIFQQIKKKNSDLDQPLNLDEVKTREKVILNENEYSIIFTPLAFTILEMLNLDDYEPTLEWTLGRLSSDFPAIEIKSTYLMLEKLNLLGNNKGISTTDEIASNSIKKYHATQLDIGKEMIHSLEPTQRYFGAITFPCAPSDIAEMKDFIRRFEDEFMNRFERKPGSEVFNISIQLYPMTSRG